jgi:hypothetical protein
MSSMGHRIAWLAYLVGSLVACATAGHPDPPGGASTADADLGLPPTIDAAASSIAASVFPSPDAARSGADASADAATADALTPASCLGPDGSPALAADAGAPGSFLWTHAFGDTQDDVALDVVVDSAGNAIAVGYFHGSTDFGAGPVAAIGNDAFVVSYAPDGSVRWHKTFGASPTVWDDAAVGVALDPCDGVVVAGTFFGAVDFGGGVLDAGTHRGTFVAKYDPDGTHVWSRVYTSSQEVRASDVAVDPAGRVTVAGAFAGVATLGGTDTHTALGILDMFVAQHDADGELLWSAAAGGESFTLAQGVGADAWGNAIVVGQYMGSFTIAPGWMHASVAASWDAFVVKYSPTGEPLWSRSYGAAATDSARAVAVRPDGGILVGGAFAGGPVTLADEPYVATGFGSDGFVVAHTAAGDGVWAYVFGLGGDDLVHKLAVDGDGRALVAGEIQGAVDAGGGPLPAAGGKDALVAVLDSAGAHLGSHSIGGFADDASRSVARDAAGTLVVAGHFRTPIMFGSLSIPSDGSTGSQAFITRLVW